MEKLMRKKAMGKLVEHPKTGELNWKPVTSSLRYSKSGESEISFEYQYLFNLIIHYLLVSKFLILFYESHNKKYKFYFLT